MKVLIDYDRDEIYMDEYKFTVYINPIVIETSSEASAIEIAKDLLINDFESHIDCVEVE